MKQALRCYREVLKRMELYKRMYCLLFNAVTDALQKLDSGTYSNARDILVQAQQKCEEIFKEQGK